MISTSQVRDNFGVSDEWRTTYQSDRSSLQIIPANPRRTSLVFHSQHKEHTYSVFLGKQLTTCTEVTEMCDPTQEFLLISEYGTVATASYS